MDNVEFNPSIFHPYFFIRKGLYLKIKQYAPLLTGDLLDFGCGAKPYKPLFGHVDSYTGVDLENTGHDHRNEDIDNYYDGKTLPFEAERFDSIFTTEVFEHVFNLDEILKELHRVIKPGGHLLITCPFVWPEHEKPYDFARYTRFALRNKLETSGFSVVIEDKSGDFFTALHQLRVAWLHDVLIPKFTIPAIVKLTQKTIIPLANLAGCLARRILPTNKDLYLSNIIVAKKHA